MNIAPLSAFRISALISLLFLSGCVHRALIPHSPPPEEQIENLTIPRIGVTAKAEVGSNMYDTIIRTTTRYTKITTKEASHGTAVDGSMSIPAGTSGVLSKTSKTNFNSLCVNGAATVLMIRGGAVCLIDQGDNGTFETASQMGYARTFTLDKPVPYVKEEGVETHDSLPNMKNEILYQGVSKESIKISFREFINNVARPAFTQDINYDLSPDGTTTIAFKGLRINVLKATTSEITYTIVKDFDR